MMRCTTRAFADLILEPSVDFAVVGRSIHMPDPSRDPQHRNTRADELQIQRERLRQALLSGARLDDAIDLMCAMRALLPKTPSKRRRPRHAVSMAEKRALGRTER